MKRNEIITSIPETFHLFFSHSFNIFMFPVEVLDQRRTFSPFFFLSLFLKIKKIKDKKNMKKHQKLIKIKKQGCFNMIGFARTMKCYLT